MCRCETLARIVTTILLVVMSASVSEAQSQEPDLMRASLEELMNMQITSASRSEQRADDVPAAVYVITQDDIRRSGLYTLPELFRLAPGVDVARINANSWAVAIRGFNDKFSNKLLVLIDGRSIYKRLFSGVFWDAEDVVVDDIDRIEIIRGPGASVWGANAVNGVINIVTKSAAETTGALIRVGGGGFEGSQALARYGGSLGNLAYRVYSQWSDHNSTDLNRSTTAGDSWDTFTGGLKLGWSRGRDAWAVDGSFLGGTSHPLWTTLYSPSPNVPPSTNGTSTWNAGSGLVRWTHTRSGDGSFEVQSYLTSSHRLDDAVDENENVIDVNLQYHTKLAKRHDVVIGGGYRFTDITLDGAFNFSLSPPDSHDSLSNAFAQDEITLGGGARLTLGSKLEHDTLASWNVQPTARIIWSPTAGHHVWAAFSRAIRTPSLKETTGRLNFAAFTSSQGLPILLGTVGDPDYSSEILKDGEIGYRFDVRSAASFDVTAFRSSYRGLPTNEPSAPVFEPTPAPPHLFIATQVENLLDADTTGVEVAAHFTPVPIWRLDGSYTGFHLSPHSDPSSLDPLAATFDGHAPAHQWQLHSSVWLGPRTEADVSLYGVGALRQLQIPAYTRADGRVEVKLTRQLSLAAAGRNLLQPDHVEFSGANAGYLATLMPRNADFQLLWRF